MRFNPTISIANRMVAISTVRGCRVNLAFSISKYLMIPAEETNPAPFLRLALILRAELAMMGPAGFEPANFAP